MTEKLCEECGEIKPIKDFKRETSLACRECYALPAQIYMPGLMNGQALSVRHHQIRYTYKISPRSVDRLWYFQGGKCAICNLQGALFIDHDHANGKVRGLLCPKCNLKLGKMRDKPDKTLVAFVAYLANPPAHKIKLRRKLKWHEQ